jgi:hexokinase
MKFNPSELAEFARYYGFHYDCCDPQILVRDTLIDMDRGLKGLPSNLAMIPAYIYPVTEVPLGKTVIALDAGGTNLRAARVSYKAVGRAVTEGLAKAPMPGTKGRLTAEQFFDEIAALAAPLFEAGEVSGIGFCFSYPMEVKESGDGVPLMFSKEVDAPEVIGKHMGQGLREALARRGVKAPERIILLNDTVSTLLCGLAEIPPSGGLIEGKDAYGAGSGPVVGFILGTGFNTAYPEKSIPKIKFSSESKPQIVVCENGNTAVRFLGRLDKEFDATTKKPGAYELEKTCAGAYLGPLSFHIFKQAIKDKVLVFDKAAEFAAWPTLETRYLNEFAHAPLCKEGPIAGLFGPGELDALRSFAYLTSIITQRAALFAASIVAATVERMGAGYDPFAPVRIAVEGTTYVRYKGMREALESYLRVLLTKEKPRSYVISPVEQASLLGAAVAALSK